MFAVLLAVLQARKWASFDREYLVMSAYPTVEGSLQADLKEVEGAVPRVQDRRRRVAKLQICARRMVRAGRESRDEGISRKLLPENSPVKRNGEIMAGWADGNRTTELLVWS